ncbi:MAG: hypothetical protein J6C85_05105 [Alphaproteobacteria bacterium]|nr:hypothetical protein [Alphaproteobacteria bacterium]
MKKIKFTPKKEQVEKCFYTIQFAIAIIALITLWFLPIKYCLIVVLLLLHNAFSYHKGKYEICIDEYEMDGYPIFGWEKMVKSWRWNIPLLVILAVILANLSLETSLIILTVYTIFLVSSYADSFSG